MLLTGYFHCPPAPIEEQLGFVHILLPAEKAAGTHQHPLLFLVEAQHGNIAAVELGVYSQFQPQVGV